MKRRKVAIYLIVIKENRVPKKCRESKYRLMFGEKCEKCVHACHVCDSSILVEN